LKIFLPFLPVFADLGRVKKVKIFIIIFVRLLKEGIDLAFVTKLIKGYPFMSVKVIISQNFDSVKTLPPLSEKIAKLRCVRITRTAVSVSHEKQCVLRQAVDLTF